MLSTSFDVLGLAALVAGVLDKWGLGWALIAAWPCLMFIGWSINAAEDKAAARTLASLARRAMRVVSAPVRARRRRAQPKVA